MAVTILANAMVFHTTIKREPGISGICMRKTAKSCPDNTLQIGHCILQVN